MARYFIEYGDYGEYFTCLADNVEHALEQFYDAGYGEVHNIYLGVAASPSYLRRLVNTGSAQSGSPA